MPYKDQPLVLLWIFIPQLCCLSVERTRAIASLAIHSYTTSYSPLLTPFSPLIPHKMGTTYLFGSPNKLCRLTSTVPTFITALHLSLSISRHILPEKSTLGW